MTPLRIRRRELLPNEPLTGILYYTDGVPTHVIEFYVEWSHRAKEFYDDKTNAWKLVPINGLPNYILDGDGNEQE